MDRRELLTRGAQAAASLGLGLLLASRQALALGGVLPLLGEPAPDFELDGVSPGPA
ncbi:MAG: peroxiredoxin, partial [Synechococcaceae bacterium WB9_2_112]|nr:peroxiredoxin [Synechococcaceae bacterium WB9_2_112]